MKIKLINSARCPEVKSIYKESIDTCQVTFKADPPVTRED
jgi:L-amino acid N-acyltransferase YncA